MAIDQNRKDKVIIKEFHLKNINDSSLTNYYKKIVREGELLQKLNHPHIVKCTDVFDENNTSYYVTEFATGVSLRDYLEQSTRFDLTKGIWIIQAVQKLLLWDKIEQDGRIDVLAILF